MGTQATESDTLTRSVIRVLLRRQGHNVQNVRTDDTGYYLHNGSRVERPTIDVSKTRRRGVRELLIIDLYGVEDVTGDGTVGDNERVIAATDKLYGDYLQPVVDTLAEYGINATLRARDVEVDVDQPTQERGARALMHRATQPHPDQQYGVVLLDPIDNRYQTAGPFPSRATARAYADRLAAEINDAQSRRDGQPDVLLFLAEHFTPEQPGFGTERITLVDGQ